MGPTMSDEALDQTKPYLDEISDRLWSNNAAVMVGAGFSRNAEPMGSSSASFPSWQELGDGFFRKLHGHSPSEDEAKYLSLLKLTEQVQAAFGRPALDELLRQEIPYRSYRPSTLHSQLLELPWRDVFTTNYDTLLEDARAFVTLKHYEVVAKKEDLLYASQPRIVKLHGNFPSPPFVITEEDYRRYPNDNAPFVNTVCQSLLENTLCLIGFSGDDPNFLQWIGWIRDQVGRENAPKIYLIGMFNRLHEADRKLLDARSIVAVDISMFSKDYGKALSKFLSHLKSRKVRAPVWPTVSTRSEPWATEVNRESYREIAAEWRRQRLEYPGWVVIPEDRRRFLWLYTERWLSRLSQMSSTDRAGLETPLDLDLAFELAWRLDRCLFPLIGELPELLEEVVLKYRDTTLALPDKSGWTRTSVFEAVTNIQLWLLRHYREEGRDEKWQAVRRGVEDDFGRLLPEHRARLRLEEVLQELFLFDPAGAKRLLVDWQSDDNLPFWEAKRAALMAEMGEVPAARSILERSLSAIRKQLNLNPVTEDYTLVAQESVVMLLLWSVERSVTVGEREMEDNNLLAELSERWDELTRYKCDPRREMELLSARLRHSSEGRGSHTTTHSFDLGFVSNKFHLGIDEEAVAGYGMLRMYEEFGMPYRMEHATFVKAPVEATLPRVRPYSPHWALTNIVRLGDGKAADGLFDREYLAGLGRDEVDGFLEIYLPALECTIVTANKSDLSEAKSIELQSKTLPEVVSRLCYKCSPAYRERLVGALSSIYGSKRRHMFANIRQFANRLFDSMSIEERIRAVPSLFDFQVPDRLHETEERDFINPVLLIDRVSLSQGEDLPVTAERIDDLFDRTTHASPDRDWAITSLVWLHERGGLNEQQCERLGRALWDGVEPPRIPVVDGYHSFVCITLPHPEDVDPEPRVKEQLRSMIRERKRDSRLDGVLDELRDSAGMIKWSKVEALELVVEFSEWWNAHKHQLHYRTPMPFGSPAEVTKRTVGKMIGALAAVLFPIPTDGDVGEVDSLREFLEDLAAQNIPASVLEVATLNILAEKRQQVLDRVATAMLDNSHDVVVDALSAASFLAHKLAQEKTAEEFAPVATMLVQGVQWRHRPALADRLRVTADLAEKQSWFLSMEALAGLLAGLGEIAAETSSGIRGNDQGGVITIRASAASLAFALFGHYQEAGLDVPEAIRRWRQVCNDPNEFSEVRNSWIVAGG